MPSTEPTPYQRLIPFESSYAAPRVEPSPRPFNDYLGDARRANQDTEATRSPTTQQEPQRSPEPEGAARSRTDEAVEQPEKSSTQESDGKSSTKQEAEANAQDAQGESSAVAGHASTEESSPPHNDPPAGKAAVNSESVAVETAEAETPPTPPESTQPTPATTSAESGEQAKRPELAVAPPTDKQGPTAPADKSATVSNAAGIEVAPIADKSVKLSTEAAVENLPTEQPQLSASNEKGSGQQDAVSASTSTPIGLDKQVDKSAAGRQAAAAAKPDDARKAAADSRSQTEVKQANHDARSSTEPAQPSVAPTTPAASEKKVDGKSAQKPSDRSPTERPTALARAANSAVSAVPTTEVTVNTPANEPSTVEEAAPVEGKSAGNERQAGNTAASPRDTGVAAPAAKTPASLVPPPRDGGGDPTLLSPQERVRFVQRVANAFQAASQHDGEIRLRLSPPELGQLKLEISIKQGVLTARMEADTPEARQVLLENLPQLRERLAEQSIRVEKFDVGVRDEGAQHQADEQSERGQRSKARRQEASLENDTTHAASPTPSIGSDQLDIVI